MEDDVDPVVQEPLVFPDNVMELPEQIIVPADAEIVEVTTPGPEGFTVSVTAAAVVVPQAFVITHIHKPASD